MNLPNPAHSLDGGIPSLLQIGRSGPALPERGRSLNTNGSHGGTKAKMNGTGLLQLAVSKLLQALDKQLSVAETAVAEHWPYPSKATGGNLG